MQPDREFLRWAWPSYELVFPLDLMLSIAIIGIAAAVAVDGYSSIPFRAKLAEALYAAHNRKVDLVEQLALSGDPLELPLLEAGAQAGGVTIDDHLSGRRAARRAESKDAPQPVSAAVGASADSRMGASRYVSSAEIVGNAILVSGSIDGRRYDFGVYPAVVDDDEAPSTYLWLCGRSRVPEGMLAQPPAVRESLPDEVLMRECRRRKGK